MRGWLPVVVLASVSVSCTADARPETSVVPTSSTVAAVGALPLVGLIDEAVAAVESELGAELDYFEINATPRLVNLFVALNEGAVVQPWVYLDGALTSAEGRPADGGTFRAGDLEVDPDAVFDTLRREIPGATIETFYVNGDGSGNVQYGALVTSASGGGLDVLLGPDGAVLSVDPID